MKILLQKIFYLIFLSAFLAGCGNGKKSDKIYHSFDDLKGAKLGVQMGTTHDKYVSDNFPDAEIVRMDTSADLYLGLDNGKYDAFIADGASFFITHGKDKRYGVLVEKLFSEPFGVGFSYDNLELRDQFNSFLKELRSNGIYDEIYRRWIDSTDTAQMPDLSGIPRSGKAIQVGCTGSSEVFDFIRNGRNAGFDIEIIERFAADLQRPVEFKSINFGGLISALVSGNVDMITAGITITPERSKQVAFSDSHFESFAIVVTLSSHLPQGYYSIEDVKDKRIGVLLGSAQEHYVVDNYVNAKLLRLEGSANLSTALKAGQCDVIILIDSDAKELIKRNPEYAILQEKLFPSDLGICFKQGNTSLRDSFNEFLKKIREDGTLDEIVSKWEQNPIDTSIPDLSVDGATESLIVGTTGMEIPYSFFKNNEIVGIDAEIATRFAASIGKKVRFEVMNFSGLMPALSAGKIDMAANSIMITEERAKEVLFSDRYAVVTASAVVLEKNLSSSHPNAVTSKIKFLQGNGSDLATSSIGVMTGSYGEFYIREHHPEANLQLFDNITDAFAALGAHKIKYVMTAYTNAINAQRQNKELFILPEQYSQEGAAVAMRKDADPQLYKGICSSIERMRSDGTLDNMVERWINVKDGNYQRADIPVHEDGKILKVGTSADREPMDFISSGKIDGFDMELVKRIAYDLGMKVEVQDMKFSALIAAVSSGKVDIIVSNFTATEERKKTLLFTDEYFMNPQVLMTSKAVSDGSSDDKVGFFKGIAESFHNNLVVEDRYKLILDGLWRTVVISFFSIIVGTLFGAGVCFMRMSRKKWLSGIAKGYIDIMRGIPVLVLLMIIFYVVFAKVDISATIVAVLTFALNFAAYASEMFRTSIEGVDRGQTEAGVAMGFTKTQTFRYIVLPQAVKTVLPVYKGESISLIKTTSIVGYIAVQDLTKASDIIRSRTFDAFFPLIVITIIYFILAWLFGLALDSLNKKSSKQ